jgi:ATP-binding cassette subfamily B protein
MAIMNPGMTFVTSALTLAVYWIGAYLVSAAGAADRLATYSQMVVFSNYAMQVIIAFIMLNLVFILLPRTQVAAGRIMEVIETTSSITSGDGAKTVKDARGTVEFQDVSFSYPDGTRALQHISFVAHPGETIAFIGATGAGKTTLVQLVDRLYDASSGRVLVDGVDVRDYGLDDLHSRVGYVPQTATLFKGTVTSNLTYGSTTNGVDENDARWAAGVAQATEFVDEMDGGFDAAIEQGGRNVSGGQRQRLAMARAIARRSEILVFDDSFSALDFATDRKLREALARECPSTTKLVVAQRVGTIRNATSIVVLDHGRVVGQGTHDELLQNCPTYQEIVNSQLSSEEVSHD